MTAKTDASLSTAAANAEIRKLAYSIWEAEGRPEGRDREHWLRAEEILASRGAQPDPGATVTDTSPKAPRPVQPGFEDVPPGIVPEMKEDPGAELKEGPGGRFAKQIADAPEEPGEGSEST